MDKLHALLPLLGPFYGSLFAFALLVFSPKPLRFFLRYLMISIIIVLSFFASLQTWNKLLPLFQEEQKGWRDSAQQKTDREVGETYTIFYQTFRPIVVKNPTSVVYLIGFSEKEHLYARMYLYPATVGLAPKVSAVADKNDHFLIVKDEKELVGQSGIVVVKQGRHSLFEVTTRK